MNFREGDLVERKSYNKDVIFVIDRILRIKGEDIAILKGIEKRIVADSKLSDLEILGSDVAGKRIRRVDNRLDERAEEYLKSKEKRFSSPYMHTGKILHLDGDRKYSEKSVNYYRKLRLKRGCKKYTRKQTTTDDYHITK